MEVYIKLGDSKTIRSEEVERNIFFDYDKEVFITGVKLIFPDNTLDHEEIAKMTGEIIDAHSIMGNGMANDLMSVAHDWKEKAVGRYMTRHGVLVDIYSKDGLIAQVPWEEAEEYCYASLGITHR